MAQTDIRFTFEVTPNTSEDASEEHSLPISLDVISFQLEEALNSPFCLEVELISHDPDIDFDVVIDQPAVFTIYQQGLAVRYVHGLVSSFEMGETGFRRTRYRAVVEPSLSRTRLTSDWRVFQQKTSEAILAEIFKANHILKAEISSRLEHTTREYVIQPGVLDFDFIQRLAAEEGYVYRIDSRADAHRILLTDIIQTFGTIATSNGAQTGQNTNNISGTQQEQNEQSRQNNPNKQSVIYNPNAGGDRQEPALRSFTYSQRVRTTRQIQRDYTFKNPRYTLEHKAYGADLSRQSAIYERYDYGTHAKYKQDAAGKPFTTTKIQSLRNDAKIAIAIGDNAKLQPGLAFELTGHTKESLNIWWRPVRITHQGTQHTASEEESATAGQSTRYEQRAELVPAADNWKADIPPPHQIEGPLIAHVTTPDGEELYCDEYGRVKVIFPWQRNEQPNEHSSCWIRVAQNWAGAGWGHMALPRKGQEVIVEFLGGDESQPIITGRTYDANHSAPYKLPALKTLATLKSKEHKGQGYNELLIDDTTGEVKTQLHSTHGATQLTMGYLTHPRAGDGSGKHRGNGFELRTDEWGAIRAAKGLYISTDAREQAQGKQLDLQEAIGILQNALILAQSMAEITQVAGGIPSDIQNQKAQLQEVFEELQKAGILLSAPRGIAVSTPQSVQISAQQNITQTAAQHADFSVNKDFRVSAGKNISLFAVDEDLKAIANKGKVQIQAQHNELEATAQSHVTISSTQGKTILAAQEEVILTSGGAYIKLKDGTVEIGAPNALVIKTAGMSTIGPQAMQWTYPQFNRVGTFNEYFVLKDHETLQPLVNQPYAIHLDDKVIEGRTDESGKTQVITTAKSEELFIEALPQEKDRIYFDVTYWGETQPFRIDFARNRTPGKDE